MQSKIVLRISSLKSSENVTVYSTYIYDKCNVTENLVPMRKDPLSTNSRTNFRDPQCDLAIVNVKPGNRLRGTLQFMNRSFPVALGRGGVIANKREGDGGTPRGIYKPLRVWWRADRHIRPLTRMPLRRITIEDGWCETPGEANYNRAIKLSPGSTGDRLRRDDHLYDYIIEIDHNTRPRVAGHGSAVFLHLARPGFAPTAGCVGMTKAAMLQLLRVLGPNTRIKIGIS